MVRIRRAWATATLTLVAVEVTALQAQADVVAGQVDNFEDDTVQDWSAGGAANPNGPANVATGGPAGANDNFLQLTAYGLPGAGGRLVVFNFMQ